MRRLWRRFFPPTCEHKFMPVWAATLDDVEGRPLAAVLECRRCGLQVIEVTP